MRMALGSVAVMWLWTYAGWLAAYFPLVPFPVPHFPTPVVSFCGISGCKLFRVGTCPLWCSFFGCHYSHLWHYINNANTVIHNVDCYMDVRNGVWPWELLTSLKLWGLLASNYYITSTTKYGGGCSISWGAFEVTQVTENWDSHLTKELLIL